MKIERILFNSFFIIMTVTTLIATTGAFVYLKESIEKGINLDLERDASLLMEELDMLIFERLQNIHSLAKLNLKNEISRGNAEKSKKLSEILSNFKASYKGVYSDLHIVDSKNQIIASSNFALIDTPYTAVNFYRPDFPNSEILIDATHPVSHALNSKFILFHVALKEKNKNSISSEYLYAEFNTLYLHRLLDKANSGGNGDRHVIVINGESHLIAVSSDLRQNPLLNTQNFKEWRNTKNQSAYLRNGQPIWSGQVVIGHANSEGYLGYPPLGWSIFLLQTTEQAYFYINTLWTIFITLLLITLLLAYGTSHLISKSISKPIVALTHWVKNNLSFNNPPKPFDKQVRASEIQDLGVAFNFMLKELEISREHCIRASKLAVIGEMSAIMAHEVRTPLGILHSAAEYLQREVSLSPEDHEVTQIILGESNRLNKLVTRLLECASPSEPKNEIQSLHELLHQAVLLLKTKIENKNHQIRMFLLPNNPIIVGDGDLLIQAFLNLLLNAIQITPEGGTIEISTRAIEESIKIEIQDNGPGINPDEIQRLFDPFFTKREGGIGLGLTVTHQIIIAHRGSITAENNQSGGASFTILLPLLA